MRWYEKLSTIILVVLWIHIIAVVIPRYIQMKTDPQLQHKTGQVVEKFMVGDQHFLQLTIAVSPEEYIGYDIGDEYEVQK